MNRKIFIGDKKGEDKNGEWKLSRCIDVSFLLLSIDSSLSRNIVERIELSREYERRERRKKREWSI